MSELSIAKLRRTRRRDRRLGVALFTVFTDTLQYDYLLEVLSQFSGNAVHQLRDDRALAFRVFRTYCADRPGLAAVFGIPDLYEIRPSENRPGTHSWIALSLRMMIYERDGFACVACGGTSRLSLDHIMPRSRGGSDAPDNLRVLCVSCNSRKKARTPEECGF